DAFGDERMRRVAGYQLGFWDAAGNPSPGASGKAVRPALVLLAAEAVGGSAEAGVPAAVAVELVHNFSLLHDDIMDRDVERRHRPTGWVAFGEGQAILAGNAMLTAAIEALVADDPHCSTTVPVLLRTVQELIDGQSSDLALEGDDTVGIDEVLAMEEGKTAALIAGAMALGALAGGADGPTVELLARAGRQVGIAFQLVDDVLGIVGDSAVTGKSASSDVRAGKRSAPVVAALRSGTPEGAELAARLAAGTPESDEDVERAVALIEAAGGVRWASGRAEQLLDEALTTLGSLPTGPTDSGEPVGDLARVAEYLVRRDR
ncbi:polyprenyl synthetase family protein, partial [Jatrophihabitans endophyticus]|uniref:polyprenyl synthetase family protein n=1 Tax=Jatrophihabitans endophyticus TaxID=1206085 RepID=UPI001A03B7C4